jgi:prepilin peptidase CpaA
MEYLLFIILNTVLIISAITDLKYQKIPNMVTFPAALTGLAYHILANGFDGFFFSVAGFVVGFLLLLFPYLMGGMGAGDVKLMGVVGTFIGPLHVLYAFIIVAFMGGIYAVLLIIFKRSYFNGFFSDQIDFLKNAILTEKHMPVSGSKGHDRPKLCYGVAIFSGTALYTVLYLTIHT